MARLQRIPIPPAQRWREFRIRAVPAIVFLVGALVMSHLWKEHVTPSSMLGEAEAPRSIVASHIAGSLRELKVQRFQLVQEGQLLCIVQTAPPELLQARLGRIQAEIEYLQASMEPAADRQRNLLDYEQLRLDWMRERAELAARRVDLQRAQNEHERLQSLHEEKLVSESEFELAEKTYEAIQAEVNEKEELISQLGQSLEEMTDIGAFSQDPASPITAAINAQEKELVLAEAELSPITLRSPMSGIVSHVHRTLGENVTAGEPILTVSATQTDQILGYLPLPSELEPEPGMEVLVSRRSGNRESSMGRILQIGPQVEAITNMALINPNNPVQIGLPIFVSRPPNLPLRPGEVVDLDIQMQ